MAGPRAALCLALGVLAGCAGAERAATPTATADFTAAELAAVDEIFAQWTAPGQPGCTVALVRGDAVAHRSYGLADIAAGTPLTPQTVFDIASTSKQFTAHAVALLLQEGTLSLDDEVHAHVPELPRYPHPVRLRHLLFHRSGLLDFEELHETFGGYTVEDDCAMTDVLALLGRVDWLMFAPGTEYSYCNTNYILLALIVERATGQTLDAVCRERLFGPLGMTRTAFREHATPEDLPGLARSYKRSAEGGFAPVTYGRVPVGDGALHTTAEDLVRWVRAEARGALPGGAELAARRARPPAFPDGPPGRYAFGLEVSTHRGLRTVSHSGGHAGWRAQILRFPDEGLGVICLCNSSGLSVSKATIRVAEALLGDRLAPPTPAVPLADPASLALLAGTYRNPHTGVRFKITASETGLDVDTPWYHDGFVPIGPRTFRSTGTTYEVRLTFAPATGTAAQLIVAQDGEGVARRELQRYSPIDPATIDFSAYPGTYHNDQIPADVTFGYEEPYLTVTVADRHGTSFVLPLEPVLTDRFGFPGGEVQFLRAPDGRIHALEIDEPYARGLVYKRTATANADAESSAATGDDR